MIKTRDLNWLLLLTVVLLCLIGLCLIYSVFQPYRYDSSDHAGYSFFKRQLAWLGFGFLAMLLGFLIPFRYFEALAYVFYAICVILLISVLFFSKGSYPHRWLSLGPIRFQPSELTKVALLFVWARILSGFSRSPSQLRRLAVVLAVFVIPFLLVLKEPDLGTAIVYFAMMLAVLYWRGFKGLHILFVLSPLIASLLVLYGQEIAQTHEALPLRIYLILIFIIAYLRRAYLIESLSLVAANVGVALLFPSLWSHLRDYQQKRIVDFLNPGADRLDAGWQVFQSKIAIGSGGIMGKGYMEGTQKALEFLPAKHTDFIFSVLGEEFGFIGVLVVLLLFFVVVYNALAIAEKSKSAFASTVCVGIACYFFFQVAINVAMTIGMTPVTGIPLPFLSYGGSSLVVSCFLTGFLLNCSVNWYEY